MRILVVDDNKAFLNLMGELLRGYGYEVLLAEDGKQAREMLQTDHVDLIVSDVFMPRLDGNRFHSYVREFLGATDVPFIFYSGYVCDQTRDIVSRSNLDYFMSKASPIEDIVGLIEKIRTAKQTREAASGR